MADNAATEHLPSFITLPGQTDTLFVVVVIFLILLIFLIGVLYFKLHALPEQMAHRGNRAQYQLVAILALIAMFTHINLFWIAALLLAAIQIPDVMGELRSISASLGRIADAQTGCDNPPGTSPIDATKPTDQTAGPAERSSASKTTQG